MDAKNITWEDDTMTQEERRIWLIQDLQKQLPDYADYQIPKTEEEQWRLLRGLFNVRPPMPASDEFLKVQGEFLREMTREKGITDGNSLEPCKKDERLSLWRGDITTLQVDAITNAANSQMLGCFLANHGCIDNIEHTMAGIEMRLRCNELMQAQGHEEPTGQAKITPGYNLPAKYVLHTVGPIVTGGLTQEHKRLLASCYKSCLELASRNLCFSVAFCCISTGVFMFPKDKAAEIAVATVLEYLNTHQSGPVQKVIFNVFTAEDYRIYDSILN